MTEDSYVRDRRRRSAALLGAPRLRAGAVLAIALLAAFVTWLLFVRGGDEPAGSLPLPSPASTVAVSEDGLRTLAAATSTPIHWVGPRRGYRYELTTTAEGEIYVRYLPRGVEVGSTGAHLTVGTYPVEDAFAATRRAAARSGSVRVPVGADAFAFYNEKAPTNVYLARRASDHQVEVYDPSGEAGRLITSRRVSEVMETDAAEVSERAGATETSARGLRGLAASRGHPVYWIGPEGGAKYELTRTLSGIYLRYLRRGDAVGTGEPRLTIGTYPMENAFAATQALALGPGAVRIPVGSEGVAFYNKDRPTNVYVAYAGADVQIEVYDAAAQRAHDLVASRRVVAVD